MRGRYYSDTNFLDVVWSISNTSPVTDGSSTIDYLLLNYLSNRESELFEKADEEGNLTVYGMHVGFIHDSIMEDVVDSLIDNLEKIASEALEDRNSLLVRSWASKQDEEHPVCQSLSMSRRHLRNYIASRIEKFFEQRHYFEVSSRRIEEVEINLIEYGKKMLRDNPHYTEVRKILDYYASCSTLV